MEDSTAQAAYYLWKKNPNNYKFNWSYCRCSLSGRIWNMRPEWREIFNWEGIDSHGARNTIRNLDNYSSEYYDRFITDRFNPEGECG